MQSRRGPNLEKRNSNAEKTSRRVLITETSFTTKSVIKKQQIEQTFKKKKRSSRYIIKLSFIDSYDKLLKIESFLNNAVAKKMKSCNGVYVPSGIQNGNRLNFAIDIEDFPNDNSNGKNQFHKTFYVVFQKVTIAVPNLIINRNNSLKPIEFLRG